MIRLILTIASLMIMFGIDAQEYLSFKGIPIEGSMTSFCNKMKEKGFRRLGKKDNTELFSGSFTGKEVTVGVMAESNGRDVFGLVVIFPSSREWNNLVETYNYYKNLYLKKYGELYYNKECNPSFSNSNSLLMFELSQGTVDYISSWDVPEGVIRLSIEKGEKFNEGQIVIFYCGKQNINEKVEQDLDDI